MTDIILVVIAVISSLILSFLEGAIEVIGLIGWAMFIGLGFTFGSIACERWVAKWEAKAQEKSAHKQNAFPVDGPWDETPTKF